MNKKYKFAIGDHVMLSDAYIESGNRRGFNNQFEAIICGMYPSPDSIVYNLEFRDRFDDGHSCSDKCENGHGWNVEECHLTKVSSPNKRRETLKELLNLYSDE